MSDADREIDALHQAWAAAIRDGQVERALELLSEDYVLWPGAAPEITGRSAVGAMLSAALGSYELEPALESIERLISGDLAVERAWDEQTIRPRSGGEARTVRQRVVLVLRRESDGRWRYARGISQPPVQNET